MYIVGHFSSEYNLNKVNIDKVPYGISYSQVFIVIAELFFYFFFVEHLAAFNQIKSNSENNTVMWLVVAGGGVRW